MGNIGQIEARGYFSGPIVPGTLSASLAYTHRQNDGDTKNDFRHVDANRLFIDQARAKLRLKPSENLDVVLAIDGTWDSSDNFVPTPNNGPLAGEPRHIFANTDTEMNRKDFGQTLKITYNINEHLSLKSITANRRDNNNPHPWDIDGLPTDSLGWNQRFLERVRSQEFQLAGDYGRLTFTSGANYYKESFDFDRLQWLKGSYTNLEAAVKYDSWGVYGQGRFALTPELGFTAGLRYNSEENGFSGASYKSNVSRQRLAQNYSVSGLVQRNSGVTPKFGIDYQLARDIFTYASYTVGEKSGGFNRAAGTKEIASIPAKPEEVTAYEIGAKTQWLDRKLTVNVAAFYNDFKEYQAGVTNPVINGQPVNGNVIVNAGQAHTKGVELEAVWKATPSLEWRLSSTILRTAFDKFLNPTGAAGADFKGNEVPNAPKFSGAARVSYRLPIPGLDGSLRINGTLRHVGSNYTDIANTKLLKAESQTYLDIGADYFTPGKWTFNFNVKNLLDRDYVVGRSVTPSLGVDTSSYNPPRTFTVTARYDFN